MKLISLLIYLGCVNHFSGYDLPQQDTLFYLANGSCFTNWKEYGKLPDYYYASVTLLKEKIDSSTYLLHGNSPLSWLPDSIYQVGSKLFYKNRNNKYSLFFDFKNLYGGYIYTKDYVYKIVYRKKIRIRGEYIYKVQAYRELAKLPSGETERKYNTLDNSALYFNKEGECVIIACGFLYSYQIRTDYFDKELTFEEINSLSR